jgi:hypothetical protein
MYLITLKLMLFFKVFVCTFYGLVSIAQTLNSRFLFKNLQFDFYSTVRLPLVRCSCCSAWSFYSSTGA